MVAILSLIATVGGIAIAALVAAIVLLALILAIIAPILIFGLGLFPVCTSLFIALCLIYGALSLI